MRVAASVPGATALLLLLLLATTAGQVVTTYAGNGSAGYAGDGGPATDAMLSSTFRGIAIDLNSGTLYIADTGNNRVRAVLPNGTVVTVAGNGTATSRGDGGPATAANAAVGGSASR